MPVKYKIDILQSLKDKGYNTNRIRKEKLFGEATLQKFRNNELVSWNNIERLCDLLGCDVGDIVTYEKE